jgi:hypothetical protein
MAAGGGRPLCGVLILLSKLSAAAWSEAELTEGENRDVEGGIVGEYSWGCLIPFWRGGLTVSNIDAVKDGKGWWRRYSGHKKL